MPNVFIGVADAIINHTPWVMIERLKAYKIVAKRADNSIELTQFGIELLTLAARENAKDARPTLREDIKACFAKAGHGQIDLF